MSQKRKKSVRQLALKSPACPFDYMYYRIDVGNEKFDSDRFREVFTKDGRARNDVMTLIAPRDQRNGDYHALLRVTLLTKEVNIKLSYYAGPKKCERNERLPPAEKVMEWLGGFIKHGTADSHVHQYFQFPLSEWRCQFPLPLKVNIRGEEDLVDGLSFRLPSTPEGVSQIRMIYGNKMLLTEVVGNRRVTFKGHSPYVDIEPVLQIVHSMLERKS